jgi:hypothetical protein
MIKRTYLLTLLFASAILAVSSVAHAASCSDFLQTLNKCESNVVGAYGFKIMKEVKENGKSIQKDIPCTKGKDVRKVCGVGHYCVSEPGSTFSYCFKPGNILHMYKDMKNQAGTLCEQIFATRQGGSNGYLTCIQNANCDLKALNKCSALLKKEKVTGTGGNLVGFLIFLLLSILLEGLLLFGVIKIIDKHNPQNTIMRAILMSTIVGICTFPFVYSFPLLGMLLSGSLLFGLIIVFYQQGVFLPAVYTAFHIIWVGAFFSMMVAMGQLGNPSWLAQPKTLRFRMIDHHANIQKEVTEFERERGTRKTKKKKEKK